MKDKLQHLIDSENLTRSGFAKMLGINPATISQIMAGRNKPSYELLQKILMRFTNVSADWLMLDSGPMLRDQSLTPSGMPRRNGALPTDDDALSLSDGLTSDAGDAATQSNGSTLFGAELFSASAPMQADHPTPPNRQAPASMPQISTSRESNISDAAVHRSVLSNSHASSQVERVVVFYTDKTFDTYIPNNK